MTESDLVNVCNTVYKEGYLGVDKTNFEQGLYNPIINNFNDKLIAGHWENWIEGLFENSKSKIDVLCGNCFSEYVRLLDNGQNIEAYQLFVQIYFWESKDVQRAIAGKKEHKSKNEKYNILIADDLVYENGYGYKEKIGIDDQFI